MILVEKLTDDKDRLATLNARFMPASLDGVVQQAEAATGSAGAALPCIKVAVLRRPRSKRLTRGSTSFVWFGPRTTTAVGCSTSLKRGNITKVLPPKRVRRPLVSPTIASARETKTDRAERVAGLLQCPSDPATNAVRRGVFCALIPFSGKFRRKNKIMAINRGVDRDGNGRKSGRADWAGGIWRSAWISLNKRERNMTNPFQPSPRSGVDRRRRLIASLNGRSIERAYQDDGAIRADLEAEAGDAVNDADPLVTHEMLDHLRELIDAPLRKSNRRQQKHARRVVFQQRRRGDRPRFPGERVARSPGIGLGPDLARSRPFLQGPDRRVETWTL